MAIVTLDAPLPRTLPPGLTTLVEAVHTHRFTQAALFLLRLHQRGDGVTLLTGDNLQCPGDTEWPFELNTYAWSARHGWICLNWPDGSLALGQKAADGGWSFIPTPFHLHPHMGAGSTALDLFETDPGMRADLARLSLFQHPPLIADRWGTPWMVGSASPVAVQRLLVFLSQAVEAAGIATDHVHRGDVLVQGSVGLGQGRWVAPEIVVDFRTHPRGPGWDDVRCVLAHRPPFSPAAVVDYNPSWMGGPPTTFEPEALAVITAPQGVSAHQRLAFQNTWTARLAEARALQGRGLCRPDTLIHPDEDL